MPDENSDPVARIPVVMHNSLCSQALLAISRIPTLPVGIIENHPPATSIPESNAAQVVVWQSVAVHVSRLLLTAVETSAAGGSRR